jgi:hypothetical protein
MDHQIRAFFYTAQDARRAMNALKANNATVSAPEPLQQSNNGRVWLLTITPVMGGLSQMYQDPTLLDAVFEIVLRYGGVTDIGLGQYRGQFYSGISDEG